MKKVLTIILAALFIACFYLIQQLQAQAPSKGYQTIKCSKATQITMDKNIFNYTLRY